MALLVIFMAFQRELIRKNKDGLMLCLVTIILAGYISMGGEIFKTLESPYEEVGQKAILKAVDNVKSKYPGIPDAAINDLLHQISASGVRGIPDGNQPTPKWTFENSVVYSITLLTTIGYGHLAPLTPWGKIATMIYTAVGIPLTLVIMSVYVCRLTTMSASFKTFLFRKLKGLLTPVQINFIHISIIMILIILGCFLIPATIFDYLEDSWTFLDSFYYCVISLTTVGLGDYVPGWNSQSSYVNLYRILSAIFIFYGVVVMMFMLAMISDFKNHFYEDVHLPITIHTENAPINQQQIPTYGTIQIHKIEIPGEDQQKLLQS